MSQPVLNNRQSLFDIANNSRLDTIVNDQETENFNRTNTDDKHINYERRCDEEIGLQKNLPNDGFAYKYIFNRAAESSPIEEQYESDLNSEDDDSYYSNDDSNPTHDQYPPINDNNYQNIPDQ